MSKTYISDSKREIWLDILKAISAILIVFQHSLSPFWCDADPSTISWAIVNAIFIISKAGVPLFFMCSGYGMLKRQRTIKEILHSIIKLLIVYLSWMFVYGIYTMLLNLINGISIKSAVLAIPKIMLLGYYHTWFIFALIALYLMTPVLYPVLQNKDTAKYVFYLSLFASTIMPFFWNMEALDSFGYTVRALDITYLSGNIFYYICGFYFGEVVLKKKNISFISTLIIYATTVLFTYFSHIGGFNEAPSYNFIYKILEIFLSISLFCMFQEFNKKSKVSGFLCHIARYGFTIYLLHPMFLFEEDNLTCSYVLIRAIAVYMISLLIGFVLYRFKYTRFLYSTGILNDTSIDN